MSVTMKVLSVDPGLKNLGFAYIVDGKLARFGVFNAVRRVEKKQQKNYPLIVHRFSRFKMFQEADIVVVERQMNQKMRCIATALVCFAWPRGLLVSPRSVKVHHGISMSNYRKNKAAAVELAPSYMSTSSRQTFRNLKHKRDDIADAVLMGFWYIETHGTESHPQVSTLLDSDSEIDEDVDIDIIEQLEHDAQPPMKEVDNTIIQLNVHAS